MPDTPPSIIDQRLIRRFVAALILRTLLDALNGDPESAGFMDEHAPSLARQVLHMHAAPVRNWRQVKLCGLPLMSNA